MAKISPVRDNILLEKVKEEEAKTKSGIYLPEGTEEKTLSKGKVVALGTAKKVEKLGLKVGDTVIYSKYSGTEVTVNEVEYLIVGAGDILAVVK